MNLNRFLTERPPCFSPGACPGLERYRRFTVVPVPDNRFFCYNNL